MRLLLLCLARGFLRAGTRDLRRARLAPAAAGVRRLHARADRRLARAAALLARVRAA